MRNRIVACACALGAQDEAEQPVVVPREWLVIAPVDGRGRRPFNPNAVLGRHLLDRAAPPPREGDHLSGELGREQAWTRRRIDENGRLGGGPIQAAFATVDWPRDGVALADLDGAAMVWVNGTPQVGDVYGDGMGGLPVAMKAGGNALFVTGARGAFRLELRGTAPALLVNPFDATIGDLAPVNESPLAALLVVNASIAERGPLVIGTGGGAGGGFERAQVVLPGLPPLGFRKVPLPVAPAGEAPADPAAASLELPVQVRLGSETVETSIAFARKAAGELARGTYRSAVDGSVQEFAVRPPSGPGTPAIVVTLHGAGVDCAGQAASYSPKPDFLLLAPTNRRRFGFDWQDWGRRDALDALEAVLDRTGIDRGSVFLTGHSMGGHGTWHLAANDPSRFAAIAPSAGWSSFDSYGGRPAGALAELWQGADGASRTLALVDNLKQVPTFILHGTADDNVPLAEAQLMLEALTRAGGAPLHHFQEGAGHWWDGDAAPGVACVDWPGIFELFRARRAAPRELPESFSFTTLDPSIADSHLGVTIVQPIEYGRPARVDCGVDPGSGLPAVTTANVRRFELRFEDPGIAAPWRIDGREAQLPPPWRAARPSAGGEPGRRHRFGFVRTRGGWSVSSGPDPGEKSPRLSGPFKRAFDREFVLVHGTAGSPAEDRELLERARYDAALWWYRANGHAPVLSDVQLLAQLDEHASRNVILYGNRDTNAAWSALLGDEGPVDARRGALRCGERTFEGDSLGALFVRPRRPPAPPDPRRPGAPDPGLVGVFADSGVAGSRLGYALSPFISGVGYPDYALFSAEILASGDGGVLAAGWFAHDWSLPQP